jgi:preprotein translocase subunit SecA
MDHFLHQTLTAHHAPKIKSNTMEEVLHICVANDQIEYLMRNTIPLLKLDSAQLHELDKALISYKSHRQPTNETVAELILHVKHELNNSHFCNVNMQARTARAVLLSRIDDHWDDHHNRIK